MKNIKYLDRGELGSSLQPIFSGYAAHIGGGGPEDVDVWFDTRAEQIRGIEELKSLDFEIIVKTPHVVNVKKKGY